MAEWRGWGTWAAHRRVRALPWTGGLVVAVLGSLVPIGGGGTEAGAATPRCKAGQVRVTVLGVVRCRTLPKASPRADQRLPLLRGVIGQDVKNLRSRRGRAIPSLASLAGGRVGRTQRRLNRSLPKILAWADARRLRTTAGRANAVAPCALTGPDSRSTIDGFSIGLSQGGDLTINAQLPGGFVLAVFVGSGVACSKADIPDCPRADGAIDGTDAHQNRVSLRVTQNGALVQQTSINVRSTQTMRAKVADDAKLETMTLTDTSRETTTVRVPGDVLVMVLTVRRTAEVDMRTGRPRGTPQVRASLELVGATRSFRQQVGADVQRKYEQSFPSLIAEEVRNYRARETAWQAPGKCAKLTFSPPSNTIKVPKGATGTVAATIESNQGGTAAGARWRVLSQANGTFSPPEARGGGTSSFAYAVTNAGPNVKLRGTFRATSTAGVAEGPWEQDAVPVVNRIAGNISMTVTIPTAAGPSVTTYSGTLGFNRSSPAIFGGASGVFTLADGGVTVTASGIDGTGSTGCQQSGSTQIVLSPGQGSMFVEGTPPDQAAPYTYSIGAMSSPAMMTITLGSCPMGGNGMTFDIPVALAFTPSQTPPSSDGISYVGTDDQTVMGAGAVFNWSFTGTE